MYSTLIAYILWFFSGFGALGFHRFYLGKIPSGIIWMLTGGLFGFGAFYDFFTLPRQVREADYRKALAGEINNPGRYRPGAKAEPDTWRYASDAQYKVMSEDRKKEHPERVILRLARENSGILTVSDFALAADIPIAEAKKYLEALVSKGFAELRVRKSGSLVYVIPDMLDKDVPLEDF